MIISLSTFFASIAQASAMTGFILTIVSFFDDSYYYFLYEKPLIKTHD